MEQTRNWMEKNLNSIAGQSSPTDPFYEEKLNNSQRTSWTLGGRVVPSKFFTMTAQARQRFERNNYKNVASSGSPIDLLDALKINSDEASTKVTWKPWRWLQSSFRYQFRNFKYYPRAIDLIESRNSMMDNTYTYDVSLQPVEPLLLMLSYSLDQLNTKTIAGSAASGHIPGFNSGVNSWLFSASYTPKENLTFTNTVLYSLADNFIDFSSTGLLTRPT